MLHLEVPEARLEGKRWWVHGLGRWGQVGTWPGQRGQDGQVGPFVSPGLTDWREPPGQGFSRGSFQPRMGRAPLLANTSTARRDSYLNAVTGG